MELLLVLILVILLVIDWAQTLMIARHPHRWREQNPILGPHPTVAQVHAYFVAVMVLLALFVAVMHDAGAWFCIPVGVMCAIQLEFVVHNWRLGLKP